MGRGERSVQRKRLFERARGVIEISGSFRHQALDESAVERLRIALTARGHAGERRVELPAFRQCARRVEVQDSLVRIERQREIELPYGIGIRAAGSQRTAQVLMGLEGVGKLARQPSERGLSGVGPVRLELRQAVVE